uniref:Uncharacterized protein n=1 Tax=Octopus bimaculoides TaxID=37653 RepID=A0A0L8G547_OCTBM
MFRKNYFFQFCVILISGSALVKFIEVGIDLSKLFYVCVLRLERFQSMKIF